MVDWWAEERMLRVQGYLGLALLWGAGLVMGYLEFRHIGRMSSTIGVTVFALVPFVVNVGLFGTGVFVWRSRLNGRETLWIAIWMLLGMSVLGLLATWTITHQNIRGRPFAHARFVTINNMTVGALLGCLLGWYRVRSRRHRRDVVEGKTRLRSREQRLEVLHRLLRHNLRNELNVIAGYGRELESDPETAPPEAAHVITEKSRELVETSEKIRQMMASLDRETDVVGVDVRAACEASVSTVRERFPDAEFDVAVPSSAGAYAKSESLLEEALSNLIENAIEHNDTSTPRVTVSVSPRDGDEDELVVRVADDGPGIPATEREVLSRGRETALAHGSGLGLWLVYWIVSESSGDLWFEENEPRGSVVAFSLKSAPVPADASANANADAVVDP